MKFLFYFIILIFVNNCSFDNKSGIWKNDNNPISDKDKQLAGFKNLSITTRPFDQIINLRSNFKFQIDERVNPLSWKDIFYNQSNNYDNYDYSNLNNLTFKSKKMSSSQVSKFILYDKKNVILTDIKGNLIIYSLKKKIIVKKFNFYKKKYKHLSKILNTIIEKNVIYVSDNLGYLYAYDYLNDKILWAKNYKIPFRSNLKIFKNKILTSNQNNSFYFFDKFSGNILDLIPTEESSVKNEFVNNLSTNNEHSLFLNTYGSLYSIDNTDMKINWFVNLNQSLDLNPSNLFRGNQVINYKDKVVVFSNNFFYILDANTGSILHKKNFTSVIKPIINNGYLFTISKNDLLIALDINSGKILYSYSVKKKIADFLNSKQKSLSIKTISMINDMIFIFLNNSYILKFDIYGNVDRITKLPTKMNTYPIFIERSIIYLNNRNKISIVN